MRDAWVIWDFFQEQYVKIGRGHTDDLGYAKRFTLDDAKEYAKRKNGNFEFLNERPAVAIIPLQER